MKVNYWKSGIKGVLTLGAGFVGNIFGMGVLLAVVTAIGFFLREVWQHSEKRAIPVAESFDPKDWTMQTKVDITAPVIGALVSVLLF